MYRSLAARLDHIEERILPKPGAEILVESSEGFAQAYQAAKNRGSIIIIDDIVVARI